MRIHREGHSTLITLGTLLGFVTAVAYAILPDRAFRLVAFASAATFGLVAQFFRDPPRITPTTPKPNTAATSASKSPSTCPF